MGAIDQDPSVIHHPAYVIIVHLAAQLKQIGLRRYFGHAVDIGGFFQRF